MTYEKMADIYENRWEKAMHDGNASEAYQASEDYKKNIKVQEESLSKMDPNSKAYEKMDRSLEEQRSKSLEMERAQRIEFSGENKKQAYQQIESENAKVSKEMEGAIKRGDTKAYDSLRNKYQTNISSQEKLGKEMKENKIDYRDTSEQNKRTVRDHDTDMASKMAKKNAERQAMNKKVSEEDRAAEEKYKKQAEKNMEDGLKEHDDKQLKKMREQGASEEDIKIQEEENRRQRGRY